MSKRVLITGGAGFIGSHLADELLTNGYKVRALDNLDPQVHGPNAVRPEYLDEDIELIAGDVRNTDAVEHALEGVDAVYHFASAVGVGQSMYQISHYVDVNNLGTSVLLEAIIRHPVRRLIVASSMSLYGEGLYETPDGAIIHGAQRGLDQLRVSDWEVRDAIKQKLSPLPTPESKHPNIASIYALSKYDQEQMCLMIGAAYNIPTVALRFFNVFGTRQALSNPYTGVLAIFASRILNGNPPVIFEDGQQQRDFVSVYDIAHACRLALEVDDADGQVMNIGSGRSITIREVANKMAAALGETDMQPEITGKYRVGDVRHCFADISRARQVLEYEPQVTLDEGIREIVPWLMEQDADDHVERARKELALRGLTL